MRYYEIYECDADITEKFFDDNQITYTEFSFRDYNVEKAETEELIDELKSRKFNSGDLFAFIENEEEKKNAILHLLDSYFVVDYEKMCEKLKELFKNEFLEIYIR